MTGKSACVKQQGLIAVARSAKTASSIFNADVFRSAATPQHPTGAQHLKALQQMRE